MQEYRYFKQTGDPEIHAAVAGINKLDWISLKYNESSDRAIELMQEYEFDILPKTNKDGVSKQYYHTIKWGLYDKSNIQWSLIRQEDCIYYLTHM